MNKINKSWFYIVGLFLCTSLISLFFCSKNSFLYSFNDWVDGNAFFTMGKGMMNGLVPYKDLFEQKGPLLYLFYGFAYLFSHSTLHGVYILEILSMTITSVYIYMFSKRFITEKLSILTSLLFIFITTSSKSFVQGGSCEEFCLPFFAYSFYSFNEIIKKNELKKQYLYIFSNGVVSGLVFMMKFNLLAFWFIWMAIVFFYFLINKKIKTSILSCLVFLLGMILPILAFLAYFIMNDALNDFIDSYILFNINSYSTVLSFNERIRNMLYAWKDQLSYNLDIKVLTILGFLSILSTWIYRNVWFILFSVGSYLFLILGVYFGGNAFIYYYLDFQIYIIFGIIGIFKILDIIYNKISYKNMKYILNITTISLVCIFSVYNICQSSNLPYIKIKKEYYAQYVFDEIISKSDDKSILNYDNLDGGFYTVSNVLPNVKYFMRQNVDYSRYPIIIDSQNDYINKKTVKYVIVREYFGNKGYRNSLIDLQNNYKLIKHHSQIYEGMDFDYYLYERR